MSTTSHPVSLCGLPMAHTDIKAPTSQASISPFNFDDAVALLRTGETVASMTQILLRSMTPTERLALLDGDEEFWTGLRGILFDRYNRAPFVMGAIPRLNIPGIRFTDGPRGIVMNSSTAFPVSMARGATWDVALEERIGDAIGLEGRAQGANYFAGICINLPRHPAWGRIQETYGEDPILLGEFGLALHRGVRKSLMTCVKHFALNSMENARFAVDVQVDDAALHEVYLPHFRQLVEAGVSSVMSSYNSVRGQFAGENKELLDEILRKEWGFQGFVLSDFIFGLRDPVESVKNGLDIEAPFRQQRAIHLPAALSSGRLKWAEVDRCCARILGAQLEHAARLRTSCPDPSIVFCDEHRGLAREAAARGIVLLKNDAVFGKPTLPLAVEEVKSLAVIGRLANKSNTGDNGSSAVFSPKVVTPYQGIKAGLPSTTITLDDTDELEAARDAARCADAVILVVGYDAADEGEYVVPSFQSQKDLLNLLPPTNCARDAEVRTTIEGQEQTGFGSGDRDTNALVPGAGGDRRSLRLRSRDVELIETVTAANPRTVVCIVAAGAVIMNEWIDRVSGVMMAWYSGCEGGHALADVILGKVDAAGRLPFSIPTREEDLPFFDIDATDIKYDRWFGQRLLDRLAVPAQFPLGFGVSYTTFSLMSYSIDARTIAWSLDRFVLKVEVLNTGSRAGRHVVQVYGLPHVPDFPSRLLLGFQSLELAAGQSKMVTVACSIRPLQRRHEGKFVSVDGEVGLEIAGFAGDPMSLKGRLSLPYVD
ncbi:glycoside hydrolase [Aureobasidium pullulans]|nr:glycoside hydrolase [Aureobasidium pullulans]